VRERTLTGPTGPVALTLPRATLFSGAGDVKEWTSRIVPRYQRRIPEVDEAVIATYRREASAHGTSAVRASGPIRLRKIDGWQKIGAVLNQHTAVAA
jgi:hypothetical protein